MSGERTVFFVRRRITFHTGEVVDLPIGMFDNKEAAGVVVNERNDAFQGLFANGWIAVARANRDGSMALEATDANIKTFMRDLGVASVGHGAMEVPLRSSGIVIPEGPKIILPH